MLIRYRIIRFKTSSGADRFMAIGGDLTVEVSYCVVTPAVRGIEVEAGRSDLALENYAG